MLPITKPPTRAAVKLPPTFMKKRRLLRSTSLRCYKYYDMSQQSLITVWVTPTFEDPRYAEFELALVSGANSRDIIRD